MTRTSLIAFASLATLLATACGGADELSATAEQKQAVVDAVRTSISDAGSGGGFEQGFAAMGVMYQVKLSSMQGNPYGPGAPRLADTGMPAAAALAGIGAARLALTATGDDCITETPTSWQADCAFEGYTLRGQATKSGDTWTFDVTMTYTAQNSMVITWSGEVTSNEAVLQGRVTARWTYSDGTSSLEWDWDSGFDLALADGCPVGGSAESTWTWRPQSGQGAGSVYQLDVSAEFGPTCGDVRFY